MIVFRYIYLLFCEINRKFPTFFITLTNISNIFDEMAKKELNMSDIFQRIVLFSESEGFKSLHQFAVKGLKYSGAEKINRYKFTGTHPSVDVLMDVSNNFDKLNMNWLLTGRGGMYRSVDQLQDNSDNKGIISGNIISGDGAINISGPTAGSQKIIYPDKTVKIEQQALINANAVSEEKAPYGDKTYKELLDQVQMQEQLIFSLRQTIETKNELIDALRDKIQTFTNKDNA